MIFWGIIAPDLGIVTIGYPKAMLVTVALWLIVGPLARPGRGGKGGGGKFKFGPMGRGRDRGGKKGGGSWKTSDDDVVNINTSFTSSSHRATSSSFKGGSVNVSFGAVQLDLLGASLDAGGATLNVKAIMGGIELMVPSDWDVEFDVAAMMGGVNDERSRPGAHEEGAPRLVISGSTNFGGVTVKSS